MKKFVKTDRGSWVCFESIAVVCIIQNSLHDVNGVRKFTAYAYMDFDLGGEAILFSHADESVVKAAVEKMFSVHSEVFFDFGGFE